ncbi:MAG: right-handed parallel beta-helix repeat-containing protein [Vicinamibacterales bacterium]
MSTLLRATAAVWLLSASTATAATYYVATNGADSAPGTVDRPFRTMLKGVTTMRAGDTLLVQPGVYEEDLNFRIPSGTSWGTAVTIRAADAANRPVLRTRGANWVLYFNNQQYVIIDGLTIDGVGVASDGVKVTGSAGHVRVQNSEILNAPGQGVLTTDGSTANEFLNLDVHDNGRRELDHGFYISSPGNLVSGCRVYRNSGWGIHLYSGGTTGANGTEVANNVIRNNVVFDNARVGGRGDGILISSGAGNTAYNNVVRGNQVGIWVDYNASSSSLYHNTIVGNHGEFGIFIGAATSGTIVRNNIVYANARNVLENRGSGGAVDHNLVGPDPRFVNLATGDYRLSSDSPAIDAGVATSVTTDIRGGSRANGAAPDIGAYEVDRPPSTPANVRVVPGSF